MFPEGVIVVKKFLSFEEQIELASECLNNYILKPYRTNLFIYEGDKSYDREKYLIHDTNKYYFDTKIRWTNLGY